MREFAELIGKTPQDVGFDMGLLECFFAWHSGQERIATSIKDAHEWMDMEMRAWLNVFKQVQRERSRQNVEWGGGQDRPDFALFPEGEVPGAADPPIQRAKQHGFGTAPGYYRALTDRATENETVSWFHILMREVAEVMESDGHAELRDKLIQVAAVAVIWIEAIDHR